MDDRDGARWRDVVKNAYGSGSTCGLRPNGDVPLDAVLPVQPARRPMAIAVQIAVVNERMR